MTHSPQVSCDHEADMRRVDHPITCRLGPYVACVLKSVPECRACWTQRHIADYATEELKIDGYRAIAIKTGGTLYLRSRNDNDFSRRYPGVVKGLAKLPNETVIDGEVVAFDADGRPSFNALQNYGSAPGSVAFYVFDVIVLAGRDLRREAFETRRELLEKKVLPKLGEPVRYLPPFDAPLPDLIASVKAQGLEGLVAKRRDSNYKPGIPPSLRRRTTSRL